VSGVASDLDREQLAALVCSAFDRHGVRVVLSGGGAASIYAPNVFESMDLDFVRLGLSRRVEDVMLELGFRKERQRHWTHPSRRERAEEEFERFRARLLEQRRPD